MEQKVYVSVVHMHVLDRYTANLLGSYRLKFAVAVARRLGVFLQTLQQLPLSAGQGGNAVICIYGLSQIDGV